MEMVPKQCKPTDCETNIKYEPINSMYPSWILSPRISFFHCEIFIRGFAERSQGGRWLVADRLQMSQESRKDDLVTMRFRLLQMKPLCDQIDGIKVFNGCMEVGDWSVIGWQLVSDKLRWLQTILAQLSVADWSPTCCRLVCKQS